MYIVYILILNLLLVIDLTVLIYYIFWINNIFIYPFTWLIIKIVYFNRTLLLLLLFYYFLAKFTIKEFGYKYIYFFNIDLKRWRLAYLNILWNITTYHIEMFSIFLFFIVITMPLFLYNKHLSIIILSLILFFFYYLK